jgi:hypothetical protein
MPTAAANDLHKPPKQAARRTAAKTGVKAARKSSAAATTPQVACATTPITYGQTVAGQLAAGDCDHPDPSDTSFYDAYTFSGQTGQVVSIRMTAGFDAFLYLLKPGETAPSYATVLNNDLSEDTTDAAIIAVLPTTGTYTIMANSRNSGETGGYTLTLRSDCSATPITNNVATAGQLQVSDCQMPNGSFVDVYSFSANTGQQVSVSLSSVTYDTLLYLFGPDGFSVIASNDDISVDNLNSRIPPGGNLGMLPATGTYYVLATSFQPNTTGNYQVTVNLSQAVCPVASISVGQTLQGGLSAGDCRLLIDGSFLDRYTFAGAAGQQIAVSMAATSTPALDTYLYLLDAGGVVIAENDDINFDGGDLNSRLPAGGGFLTLPASGTYTILANSAAAGMTGNYSLNVDGNGGIGSVVISEFRFSGPAGPFGEYDEYVELYNNTDEPVVVQSADGTGGWALVARAEEQALCPNGAQGVSALFRLTLIPNGTVIPARGHYLVANSSGYSLGGVAAPDRTYSGVDIRPKLPPAAACDGSVGDWGLALFSVDVGPAANINNRIDAVGGANERTGLFREGAGVAAYATGEQDSSQHALVRDLSGGRPRDSGDNASDFRLVSTAAESVGGAASRFGAPGPQNTQSPVVRGIKAHLIDVGCTGTSTGAGGASLTTCARHRDLTPDPANNSAAGTLSIRRRFTNNTGASVTALRFQIVDITAGPAPAGTADLRARSSGDYTAVCVGGGGCTAGSLVNVRGTTLGAPSGAGGGLNASLAAPTIALATPLAPGNSVNVQFLLGVQQEGSFRFLIIVEALPGLAPATGSSAAPKRPARAAGSSAHSK